MLLPSAIKSSISSSFSKSISTDCSLINFFLISSITFSYLGCFSGEIFIILYILKPKLVFIGPKVSFNLH